MVNRARRGCKSCTAADSRLIAGCSLTTAGAFEERPSVAARCTQVHDADGVHEGAAGLRSNAEQESGRASASELLTSRRFDPTIRYLAQAALGMIGALRACDLRNDRDDPRQ